MIEFARPAALWLSLPLPFWLAWSWRRPVSLCLPLAALRHPMLPAKAQSTPGASRGALLMRAAAVSFLFVALAQPRQPLGWIAPAPIGRDIALILDISSSMSRDDFALDGKAITRMAMVQRVLHDFIDSRPSDRFSVMVFGGGAAVLTPPTRDRQHVLRQLDRLQVGALGDYTASGDALALALRSVRDEQPRPALIFVGDGDPANAGDMQPAEALALARALQVPVHTMQIGSAMTATADEDIQPTLADIAHLTGGRHAVVRNVDDARRFLRLVDAVEPTIRPAPKARRMREWYPLPLGAALLLLALAGSIDARIQRRQADRP